MTFETLLFIHKLLKQEEESTRNAYNSRRRRLEELRDQEASREEIQEAKQMKEAADRIHCKVLRALNDFEEQDWR